jgi:SAM-dependent methyltransferase
MDLAAAGLERELEARLRSGGARLGNPELLSRISARARALGAVRIVDLGSGCGELVGLLRSGGQQAVGLDRCRSLLERKTGGPGLQGDVESLPLATGRVDLATLVLVLHYVARPERALAEVARILRPGGRLILADRIASPEPGLRELQDRIERLRNPLLHRILTPGEIGEGIAAAGLEEEESEPFEDAVSLEAWLAGVGGDRALRIRRELAGLPTPDLGGIRVDPEGKIRLRIRIYTARKPTGLTACP